MNLEHRASVSLKYFAYGSNLLLQRIQARTPSARFISAARLPGYSLRFHKSSMDGSGKCNAFQTGDPEDEIHGVLYDIEVSEKPVLDRAEELGYGYDEREVQVILPQGNTVTATMYVALPNRLDDTLKPYGWYKAFVVEGARQHGLPESYICWLETVEAIPDPNRDRDQRNRRLLPSTNRRHSRGANE